MKKPYQIDAQRAVKQFEALAVRMEIRRCRWCCRMAEMMGWLRKGVGEPIVWPLQPKSGPGLLPEDSTAAPAGWLSCAICRQRSARFCAASSQAAFSLLRRVHRRDGAYAQFGGFFDQPLESIELDQRGAEVQAQRGRRRLDRSTTRKATRSFSTTVIAARQTAEPSEISYSWPGCARSTRAR